MSRYAPDLARHRFYVWLNNYHWVPIFLLAAILYAIGGVPLFFWGIFLRVTVSLHATWLVNSAAHMWGYRRFNTRDDSRNTWWVALFSFGEGWHNNHHAHPTSARHGLAWFEIDLSYMLLRLMEVFGLAWNIKVAKLAAPMAEREAA
jgi:stearoyl-CoA desaturase (delta-9 desaturase)